MITKCLYGNKRLMEQEKRPNVTAREPTLSQKLAAYWDEAMGRFELIAVPEPEDPDHAVIRKHWESMGNL